MMEIFDLGEDGEEIAKASKVVLMMLKFVFLFLLSLYTANLAALISQRINKIGYQSIEDVVTSGGKICVLQAYKSSMVSQYDAPEDSLELYESRSDIPEGIRSGVCDAAYVEGEDFESFHALGNYCEMKADIGPLQILTQGFPVADAYAESFAYWITNIKATGFHDQLRKESFPTSQCGAQGDQENVNVIQFDQVMYLFIVPVIIIIGVFVIAKKFYEKKARESKMYTDRKAADLERQETFALSEPFEKHQQDIIQEPHLVQKPQQIMQHRQHQVIPEL